MKTLQEIKDEVAKDFDYASFTTLYNLDEVSNAVIDELMQRYAIEALKEASKRVSGWPSHTKTESEIEDDILNIINELI